MNLQKTGVTLSISLISVSTCVQPTLAVPVQSQTSTRNSAMTANDPHAYLFMGSKNAAMRTPQPTVALSMHPQLPEPTGSHLLNGVTSQPLDSFSSGFSDEETALSSLPEIDAKESKSAIVLNSIGMQYQGSQSAAETASPGGHVAQPLVIQSDVIRTNEYQLHDISLPQVSKAKLTGFSGKPVAMSHETRPSELSAEQLALSHETRPSELDSKRVALSNETQPSELSAKQVAMSNETKSSDLRSSLLNELAQLAPDQIISQASGDSQVTAIPIPPVVTGTVDLEEFKATNVLDLKTSQSRTFRLKNKIVRTSISDPGIAEPVVVSENQILLLGKTPGNATLVLWDDAGNSVAIDVRVSRDYSMLQSMLREIDPRIIVKPFSVGGSDRVLLMGDVDHPDSVIRAFAACNVFMDDRGMTIQVANSRLINARIGETGGASTSGGGSTGQLASLNSVDRYVFFPNTNNNIGKAQVMTSDGNRVTSLIKVRKVPLIVLHVTFMEMNSTAARALGVQLGFNYSGDNFAFGIGGNNSLLSGATADTSVLTAAPGYTGLGYLTPVNFLGTTSGTTGGTTGNATGIGLGVLNTPSALLSTATLFGSPGGADFTTGGLANLFTSVLTTGSRNRFSMSPTVQGIISHNRARIIAEPTLTTLSGERASFLAGGEIPIVQSIATAGASQQSITFEPFGLRLNMIPVLMENGSLNLEISPEERIVSTQFALNLPGSTTSIPGFTTRKTQTIVEMKPGQELFISGLITANSGRQLTKTPVIGEIPVLGALYRSKAFSKNESELVVAIRPEIILPGTPGQLKLPEEIGRVEGPRDMNIFQVEPTVVDERHYSSGRDERHQRTSPTLPEGSAIPDSE